MNLLTSLGTILSVSCGVPTMIIVTGGYYYQSFHPWIYAGLAAGIVLVYFGVKLAVQHRQSQEK